MGRLFNYDNKLFRSLGKVVDFVILSFLWTLFSIPIFTIGASTSALYYAVHKSIRRDKGYVYSSFWEGFKGSFKKSTLVWLIQLVIFLIIAFDIYITNQWVKMGNGWGGLYFIFLIILLYLLVWFVYTSAYSARFDNTVKNIMKNSAIFQIIHIPFSVLILVLLLVVAMLVYLVFPLILFLPAALCSIYEIIFEKIFRKYMTEEDLAAEIEEDMFNKD